MRRQPAAGASGEAVVAAVRVHADRVHDAVRRQGCPPREAPAVVEQTALDLVDRAAGGDAALPVLLGEWFAAAAAQGRGPDGDGELLVGRGPLADDAQQRLLAGVLQGAPEPARTALLLSDAYDLPLTTVAAALGAEPDDAALLLGRARLAVLPELFAPGAEPDPAHPGHAVDEPALARLAAGGAPSGRDATAARHVRVCPRCRALVEAQEDVRRLLAGLSVVALPDDEREALLARVTDRAEGALPTEAVLLAAQEQDEDDEPRRLLSPLPVLLALGLAVVTGVGLGVLLSQTTTVEAAQVTPLPAVTAPPLTPLPERPTPEPVARPSTRVFTLRPTTPPPTTTPPPPTSSPSPSASASPTPSPSPTPTAADATVAVTPAAGPPGARVVVTGAGWEPGSVVSIAYLRADGSRTSSTASAEADADGAFRATLVTRDRRQRTGEHVVLASDGTTSARAPYVAGVPG